MKVRLLLFLLSLPLFLSAQTVDSTAIRQVDSLIKASVSFIYKRDYGKALAINEIAEQMALEKIGRESASYGTSCQNRGVILMAQQKFAEAEKWLLEAKRVRAQVLGRVHVHYAKTLNRLATLYLFTGDYEKAASYYLETKEIRGKTVGKAHTSYCGVLINLGNLYWKIGQFDQAEEVLLEAKDIFENQSKKTNHRFYWNGVYMLAQLYFEMGYYEKAEPIFLKVQTDWGERYGKDSPKYATVLSSLAMLYLQLGRYALAESLHLQTKNIREKALGKEHPEYANTLNSMAALYGKMGNHENAKQLYLEAKEIREKILGTDHPDYAEVLHNLSAIYAREGNREMAISYADDAMRIWEKKMGKESIHYAVALNSFAERHEELGLFEKAEPLYLECMSIRERVLGKGHPVYASSLIQLGDLYSRMGQIEEAEPLYLAAKEIIETAVGKIHTDYAKALKRLMDYYVENGQSTIAEPLLLELSIVNKNLMENAMQHLSQRELSNYLNTFSDNQDQALSFAHQTGSPEVALACYDNSLFYKGFLLNATSQIKRIAISDAAAAEKLDELKGYQRRLASLYAQPIAERDSTVIASLETKVNDLEKDLSRTVSGFGNTIRQIRWREVQQALQPGEAAVEFVHYSYYGKQATDSTLYAALILHPDRETPSFIPLFEQQTLDSLLAQPSNDRYHYINNLYSLANKQALGQKSLYELLWQPLERELDGMQKIYFSPSGLLHKLNHNAIPINQEEFLSDRYQLVRLNSTRELVAAVDDGRYSDF